MTSLVLLLTLLLHACCSWHTKCCCVVGHHLWGSLCWAVPSPGHHFGLSHIVYNSDQMLPNLPRLVSTISFSIFQSTLNLDFYWELMLNLLYYGLIEVIFDN